jgi:non-specific serine/threonine protein kinase/serine/threonine-protein kinase
MTEEESVFYEALARSNAEERAAFLDAACLGKPELRAAVESLLAASRMDSFLTRPAVTRLDATIAGGSIAEGPASTIGPYKLQRQIGEGGFGTVYMAEQEKPVRRMVALKIIKPGMDTAQVIARFESERQALAIMDHPNIAKVHDAGATESGRPYFVMELVKGVPITEFCDANHSSVETRLRLFVDVCHGIQHAHHKGIIHRDIKPSNVMVTLLDGVPVVKVIDFGVAKATAQKLTERTLFTAYGQMIGTPAYMSPEQAEMSGLDIDTRSDVYSLGVLLYELLTGTTPLESKRLREAGYAEIQRIICEEDPPRPSTRLSSLGDSATVQAGNRGLEVKRLVQLLAGDLDWVVMKALEKDRNRRYETPAALAMDLLRHLYDEPVQACPPSASYRLRKFVKRHLGPVIGASLLMLALVAGTIGTSHGLVEARKQRDTATLAASAEKDAKESALAREAETKAVLGFVKDHILAAARPLGQSGGRGSDVTMRRAIEDALPYVENRFSDQPLIEARLRDTIAMSFIYLGDPEAAEVQLVRARELFAAQLGISHPDTLSTMNSLALSYTDLGRHPEALKLNEETLELRIATLGPEHVETLTSMNNLANSYSALGRNDDALTLREKTFALQKATLGIDHPNTLRTMGNLSNSYSVFQRHTEAIELDEETLRRRIATLGDSHPDTLMNMNNLANKYAAVKRDAEALELRQKTLEIRRANLPPDHSDTLTSMHNLASSYATLGRHAEALELRQETFEIRKEKLGMEHPHTLFSILSIVASLVELDRGDEALPLIDGCLDRAVGKVVDPRLIPRLVDYQMKIFQKKRDAANCLETAGQWEGRQLTDAQSFYQATRFRAVCATVVLADQSNDDAIRQSNEQADLAIAWLRQAIAAGYDDVPKLKEDGDLSILRNRSDFNKLQQSLEHQKGAAASPTP